MKNVDNILVPLDFHIKPEWREKLLAYSIHICQRLDAGLTILTVDVAVPAGDKVERTDSEVERETLVAYKREAESLGVKTIAKIVKPGVTYKTVEESILECAKDSGMIIMLTHGVDGLERFLFGSVTESIIRQTTLPVVAIHAEKTGGFRGQPMRVLVPMDGTEHCTQTLHEWLPLLGALAGSVTLLHVMKSTSSEGADGKSLHLLSPRAVAAGSKALEAALRSVEASGVDIPLLETKLADVHDGERVGDAIVRASEDYDLVLMGTHGRSGVARLVKGSVLEHVLRHAVRPVLAVRRVGSRH